MHGLGMEVLDRFHGQERRARAWTPVLGTGSTWGFLKVEGHMLIDREPRHPSRSVNQGFRNEPRPERARKR